MHEDLKEFKEKKYSKILQKDVVLEVEEENETKNEEAYDKIISKYRKIRLCGHTDSVFSISVSVDKKFVISGGFDEQIRLWSIHTKTTLAVFKGHFSPVYSVTFSPVGHFFASGGGDKLAYFWSVSSVGPLRVFSGHLADVEVCL